MLLIVLLIVSGVLFWRTYENFNFNPEFYYVHQVLGSWLCIARGSAAVLNLCCAVILLPMCRSLTTLVRKICRKINVSTTRVIIDSSKLFHIGCGYLIVFFSFLHVAAHCINIVQFTIHHNNRFPAVDPSYNTDKHIVWVVLESIPGWTGIVMIVILAVLYISSLRTFRSHWFNAFWYSHKLFVLFYALAVIHGLHGPVRRQLNVQRHFPGCNDTSSHAVHTLKFDPEITKSCIEPPEFGHTTLETWKWIVGPFILYICDCIYRYIRGTPPVFIKTVTTLSDHVISITLVKQGFALKPGQCVLIKDPRVSLVEWHPYSVVQSSDSKEITIWLKDQGDWSNLVKHHLEIVFQKDPEAANDFDNVKNRTLYVDGPFCSSFQDIQKFDVSICIAGGIGITPYLSHLNSISENLHKKMKLKQLVLVVCTRDLKFIYSCSKYIGELVNKIHNIRPDLIDVQFYLTSHNLSDEEKRQNLSYGHIIIGRPRFDVLLTEISSSYKKCRFGVFACGPSTMANQVKEICQIKNCGKNLLYFHKESF